VDNDPETILQIVPRLPGTRDGVGDYALNLARALLTRHRLSTVFAVAEQTAVTVKDGFPIAELSLDSVESLAQRYRHVILHYVNYGYQPRGIPFQLRDFSQQLRSHLSGRWITVFHELYAFGPPWRSAFWLRPFQVKIARNLIDLSDTCFVSNDVIANEIRAYDSNKAVRILPVMSNFGEPELNKFGERSPGRWAICGGTALILRSLRSFQTAQRMIPEIYRPQQLDVIGGSDDARIRNLLRDICQSSPGLSCRYHPEIAVGRASEILRDCAFGWINYFGRGRVWSGMIFKSTAFAACCAHGVVPILQHEEDIIAVNEDALPGPFFITRQKARLPDPQRMPETRENVYRWYHRHASSTQAAHAYAEALA